MATAYKINLQPGDLGNFHHGGYNETTATTINQCLQHNLDSWHIAFWGLRHNHIVHDLLSVYGLGATPEQLEHVYERESAYQKPRYPVDENVITTMADKIRFQEFLGLPEHYSNFLLFFQREIEIKGVKMTLEEHVFAETELANRLLGRLYTSIFHGYLHLGFGFEFNQPAIVAEALGMACIHDEEGAVIVPMFLRSEIAAGGVAQKGNKSLRQLMEEARRNEKIDKAAREGGVLYDRPQNIARAAMNEMVGYAEQYSVSDDQLVERVDEMIDTCALLLTSKPPAIPPDQPHKTDFFLLHTVNTLVLMVSFIDHDWISRRNATRIIEWAGRLHLLVYLAQRTPPITADYIDDYPTVSTWEQLFCRAISHPTDDGHLVKCVRSLAFGEKSMSKKYNAEKFRVKPEAWLKIANLVVDLVPWEAQTSEERWLLFWPNE